MLNLTRLSDEGIINRQDAIKKILSVDVPRLEQLRNQITSLELSTCKLRSDYKDLSHELYIRTNEITICSSPKAKKKSSKKKPSKKQANNLIKNLIKEYGIEKVKQMLEKM